MYPHDINWENLNISRSQIFFRRILSYFLLIIFIIAYFLIILVISRIQSTFKSKYNLSLDCSNIDFKNNKYIYNEFINDKINEKEKVYTYCYCQSNLNREKKNF